MITLSDLPWPPTVNHYWRNTSRGTLISEKGRQYRSTLWYAMRQRKAFKMFMDGERLGIKIDAFPPDRRRRDLDNLLKALLDSLEHAKLFKDDSQLDSIEIRRMSIIRDGKVDIHLRILRGGACVV
jgi:crossover junction endodeoxyribonuclease RusA